MKKKVKIINISIFLLILIMMPIIVLFNHNNEISYQERRKLAKMPTLDTKNFSDKFEDAFVDQFPFRSNFISLKAFISYNVFGKGENNNVAIKNGSAINLTRNYNYDNIDVTMERLKRVQSVLKIKDSSLVIIPDKSYFLDDTLNYDYDIILSKISNFDGDVIDCSNLLSLSDYYKTDSHWEQKEIKDVADLIMNNLGNEIIGVKYTENIVNDFYGVYSAQSGLFSENICYLTSDTLNNCIVFNYETEKTTGVYDLEKIEKETCVDKYDLFLSGATPLLRIDTPITNGKTLYVFRDSFTSSLAPYFVDYYQTIYLIDLRYITLSYLKNYITINEDDDVLFIYNTSLINIPNNFQVN